MTLRIEYDAFVREFCWLEDPRAKREFVDRLDRLLEVQRVKCADDAVPEPDPLEGMDVALDPDLVREAILEAKP